MAVKQLRVISTNLFYFVLFYLWIISSFIFLFIYIILSCKHNFLFHGCFQMTFKNENSSSGRTFYDLSFLRAKFCSIFVAVYSHPSQNKHTWTEIWNYNAKWKCRKACDFYKLLSNILLRIVFDIFFTSLWNILLIISTESVKFFF